MLASPAARRDGGWGGLGGCGPLPPFCLPVSLRAGALALAGHGRFLSEVVFGVWLLVLPEDSPPPPRAAAAAEQGGAAVAAVCAAHGPAAVCVLTGQRLLVVDASTGALSVHAPLHRVRGSALRLGAPCAGAATLSLELDPLAGGLGGLGRGAVSGGLSALARPLLAHRPPAATGGGGGCSGGHAGGGGETRRQQAAEQKGTQPPPTENVVALDGEDARAMHARLLLALRAFRDRQQLASAAKPAVSVEGTAGATAVGSSKTAGAAGAADGEGARSAIKSEELGGGAGGYALLEDSDDGDD